MMKKILYTLALLVVIPAMLSCQAKAERAASEGAATEQAALPEEKAGHTAAEYMKLVAPDISQTEFYLIDDAVAIAEGANKSNMSERKDGRDFIYIKFGDNEDTKFIILRTWPMDEGNTLAGVYFVQNEEVPKLKFYKVADATMTANRIDLPIKVDAEIPDDDLIYSLEPDSPDVEIITYAHYDENDNPLQWKASWKGDHFEVRRVTE